MIELTKAIEVQGRKIDTVVKEFNLQIIKTTNENVPKYLYAPYWNNKNSK